MRTEVVRLGFVAPSSVSARTCIDRTNTVTPMVLVCKAAARPANHDMSDLLDVLHELGANSPKIGDLGILADPDAVVDHAPDVFGKLAVNRRLDRADWLIKQYPGGQLRCRARPA